MSQAWHTDPGRRYPPRAHQPDPIAVERAITGEWPRPPLRPIERHLAIARLDRLRLSAREIAERLGIAERTVCRHRAARRLSTGDPHKLCTGS